MFSPLAPPAHALGLETIYEGYLVHYGRSRLFAPADRDTALLLGDYLYAHGLVHVAESGDVGAVSDLAELISLCAQSRADGRDGDGAAWAATSASLGGGGLELARAALRESTATRACSTRWHVSSRATRPSQRRSLHTPDSSARVAAMIAAFLELLAASEKTAAEEGRDIVLSMLVVGLVFVAVALLGDLYARGARKRHNSRH